MIALPQPNFEKLREMLNAVGRHAILPKETTIFSLGGRGYYENPVTALLSFFLEPEEEHGLGNTFASCLLEAAGLAKQCGLPVSLVQRNVRTADNKWIDLLVVGTDWCLVIENKLFAELDNPFDSYKKHAHTLGRFKVNLRVLSPSGALPSEIRQGDWKGLSYQDFLKPLKRELAQRCFQLPYSKWHVLAREFILHIENEICGSLMNDEQIKFVEGHVLELEQARQLMKRYQVFLLDFVRSELQNDPAYKITPMGDGFAIWVECRDRWGDAKIAFCPPFHDKNKSAFALSFYPPSGKVWSDSEELRQRFVKGRWLDPYSCWSQRGFETKEEICLFMTELIKTIERLCKTTPE